MNKKEKIKYGYSLTKQVSSKLLRENETYTLDTEQEYLREILTLYAKQTNLFNSTMTLLCENHSEEAYILFRSMLNNAMLISYLCIDKANYKDYMIQPEKGELSFLCNVREAAKQRWIDRPRGLNKKIKELEEHLIEKGFTKNNKDGKEIVDKSFLTIRKMALTSAYNFFLYMLIYEESSKYEHSDFMSLSIYRENVETESPNKISFKLNLKRTNPELGEKILNYSNIVYAGTFEEIFKHVKKFHPQVFAQEQIKELNSIYSTMSENSIHFPYGTNDGEEHNSRNTSSV